MTQENNPSLSDESTAVPNEPTEQSSADADDGSIKLTPNEWRDFRREFRSIKNELAELKNPASPKPESKPVGRPPKSDDKLGKLEQEMESIRLESQFFRQLHRSGFDLTPEQQDFIESAYRSQKPNSDELGKWIQKAAKMVGAKDKGTPDAPSQNTNQPNNPGPPGRAENNIINPEEFARQYPEKWAAMEYSEMREMINKYNRSIGKHSDALVPAHLRGSK